MALATKNAKEIFVELVSRHDPDQWDEQLQSHCGGDDPLMDRVRALLRAHKVQDSFLIRPADPGLATIDESPTRAVGMLIGPYKLLEQIGEGGMGLVYVAEQTHPVRRRVALKLIKPGMDTRQVIARFEAERQALAMMDHPNIARVLDAGTVDVRPYFVMELVRGLAITDYCDQARLSPRERLKLFIDVCHAVQHAHQKGVIHRDLKPSNVMVTLHDGKPVVKVIDFGVAKAVGCQLTERTIYTAHTQLVGTPLYMSPEQAELSGLDVDTRSDVYSLGVLLYELLTGQTPFDKETLSQAGFDEMRRIIREDEPPRPSQRVSTLNAQVISTVSQRRGLEERKLSQTLRGELDWIVMKSLEKDRTRRYESAGALAADVERYLTDEPVQACPPSTIYRFQKLARRHRAAIATVATMAATLFVAMVVSLGQAIEANQARQVADDRLTGEQKARREAEQARRDAEAQRDRANRERLRAERERERAESERLRAESERRRVESEQLRVQRNLESAMEAIDRLLAHVGAWDLSGVPFLPAPIGDRIRSDAVELYERLLADSDNAPAVRHALAKFQVAVAHSAGTKREAQLQSAVATLEELAKADPHNRKFQQSLAMAYFTIGNYYWNQSENPDLDKAADFKRRSSSLFGELDAAGVQPTELGTRFGSFLDLRVNSQIQLSKVLSSLGRSSEADEAMREAERIAEKIHDPLSSALAPVLKMRANRIANSAPEDADELYRRALDTSRRRLAEGLAPGGWAQNALAWDLIRFAQHTSMRTPAEAERARDEAIGVLRRAISGLGNASYRFTFTEAVLIQARMLLAKEVADAPAGAKTLEERRQKAAALLAEALTFANQIREEFPDDQRYIRRLTELTKLHTQHFGKRPASNSAPTNPKSQNPVP